MSLRSVFLNVCKMACVGGSESGRCDCARPVDCVARTIPGYEAAYEEASREAVKRMAAKFGIPLSVLDDAMRDDA